MLQSVVGRFDAWLRRRYGVFEFCEDPECLLRLRLSQAPHTLTLGDDVLPAGEPILELHLWNEHIPLPTGGADLVWASKVYRFWIRSLRGAAAYLQSDRQLAGVRAVGGATVLLAPSYSAGGQRLMQRLGFTIIPYRGRLGGFGEFWENFYSWVIMWAFNPASLHHRSLTRLRREEVWMSAGEFVRRYGSRQPPAGSPQAQIDPEDVSPCPLSLDRMSATRRVKAS